MAFSFNRNWDINRVVRKLIYTILGLFVGGTILTTFGQVMNATASPFYSGLSLIGWTVSSTAVACGSQGTVTNCITATTGTGILSVVGIISIASVVLEFVTWK